MKDRPRRRVHVQATGRAGPVLPLLLGRVPLEHPLGLAPLAEGVFPVRGVAGVPQPAQAGLVVGEVTRGTPSASSRTPSELRAWGSSGYQVPYINYDTLGLYSQGIVASPVRRQHVGRDFPAAGRTPATRAVCGSSLRRKVRIGRSAAAT